MCMKHIQKKVRKIMFRMTTLKISLLSALATLFLLVSMLASTGTASAHTATGTASAHTASCQPPNCSPPPHPYLFLESPETQLGPYCKQVSVEGVGFAPGTDYLYATNVAYPTYAMTTSPGWVTSTGDFFINTERICGWNFGSQHNTVLLYAIDSDGVWSNEVWV